MTCVALRANRILREGGLGYMGCVQGAWESSKRLLSTLCRQGAW